MVLVHDLCMLLLNYPSGAFTVWAWSSACGAGASDLPYSGHEAKPTKSLPGKTRLSNADHSTYPRRRCCFWWSPVGDPGQLPSVACCWLRRSSSLYFEGEHGINGANLPLFPCSKQLYHSFQCLPFQQYSGMFPHKKKLGSFWSGTPRSSPWAFQWCTTERPLFITQVLPYLFQFINTETHICSLRAHASVSMI